MAAYARIRSDLTGLSSGRRSEQTEMRRCSTLTGPTNNEQSMHLYSAQARRAYKICVGVVVWRGDDCVGKLKVHWLAAKKENRTVSKDIVSKSARASR